MSRSATAASAPAPSDTEPLARLLDGLSRAVAAKGYAATTISDVVAEAAVSRRTFYEHFASMEECFVSLYERAGEEGLAVLGQAIDPARSWPGQLDHALGAYFAWMAGRPAILRAMFIDILALGPPGLAARRRTQERIAAFILSTANRSRPSRSPVQRAMALAIIGAIHELVLDRLEAGDPAGIRSLASVAADLVRRLTESTPRPARRKAA